MTSDQITRRQPLDWSTVEQWAQQNRIPVGAIRMINRYFDIQGTIDSNTFSLWLNNNLRPRARRWIYELYRPLLEQVFGNYQLQQIEYAVNYSGNRLGDEIQQRNRNIIENERRQPPQEVDIPRRRNPATMNPETNEPTPTPATAQPSTRK